MNLSDYCLPGADPDLAEPFAGRLLKLLEYFGGRLMILSGRRNTAEQQVLYDRRKAYLDDPEKWVAEHPGEEVPATAAVPGSSEHEFGRAADLRRIDPSLSWGEVHYTAHGMGLFFPIPNEDWHTQADPAFIDPPQDEDDMTDDQIEKLAKAIAREIAAIPVTVHDYDNNVGIESNLAQVKGWDHDELGLIRRK